jgi:hypothetical protein
VDPTITSFSDFGCGTIYAAPAVLRQSKDILRFAQMNLIFTTRLRVKPMKNALEVDKIFRIGKSCEVMLRAMTTTVPVKVKRACRAHFFQL